MTTDPAGPRREEVNVQWTLRQEVAGHHGAGPGMLKMWSVPPPEPTVHLKEVVAVIRPQRWTATKLRVQRLRLQAFTQQRVLGRGRERGLRYLPRKGAAPETAVRYLPKRMISWVVEEAQVEPLVAAIIEANRTGHIGDGKIFVLPIEGAVRVRTGDRGAEALRPQSSFELVRGTAQHGVPEVEHASR
jgi:nitrogen regulatory protein PII 2